MEVDAGVKIPFHYYPAELYSEIKKETLGLKKDITKIWTGNK